MASYELSTVLRAGTPHPQNLATPFDAIPPSLPSSSTLSPDIEPSLQVPTQTTTSTSAIDPNRCATDV